MIRDRDLLVFPFRVDQHDEIDRSIGVEKADPLDLGSVGRKGDLHPTFLVHVARLAHSVTIVWSRPDDLKALEHAQAGLNLLAWKPE